MARRKENKHITISKDDKKSYVHIMEKEKLIGLLMWYYKERKWVFEDSQK